MTDRSSFFDSADESDPRPGSRGRDRRFLRWLAIGVVLVLALLYVGGYAFASDRLPQGTTVAGVEVGGQRPPSAEQELRNSLRD